MTAFIKQFWTILAFEDIEGSDNLSHKLTMSAKAAGWRHDTRPFGFFEVYCMLIIKKQPWKNANCYAFVVDTKHTSLGHQFVFKKIQVLRN